MWLVIWMTDSDKRSWKECSDLEETKNTLEILLTDGYMDESVYDEDIWIYSPEADEYCFNNYREFGEIFGE